MRGDEPGLGDAYVQDAGQMVMDPDDLDKVLVIVPHPPHIIP
jgi:hypothetical protein